MKDKNNLKSQKQKILNSTTYKHFDHVTNVQRSEYSSVNIKMRRFINGYRSDTFLLNAKLIITEIKRCLKLSRDIILSGGVILIVCPSNLKSRLTDIFTPTNQSIFVDSKIQSYGMFTNYKVRSEEGTGNNSIQKLPNLIIFLGASAKVSRETSKLFIPSIAFLNINDPSYDCDYVIPVGNFSDKILLFYGNLIMQSITLKI